MPPTNSQPSRLLCLSNVNVCLSCRYTGHTLAKFFVTLTTGLVTGLTAAAAAATLEFVFWRKQQAVQYVIDAVHHKTLFAAFGLHLLITTGLLMFAACLVWSISTHQACCHLSICIFQAYLLFPLVMLWHMTRASSHNSCDTRQRSAIA